MSIQIFIGILILLVNSLSLFISRANTFSFSFCRYCGAVVCLLDTDSIWICVHHCVKECFAGCSIFFIVFFFFWVNVE